MEFDWISEKKILLEVLNELIDELVTMIQELIDFKAEKECVSKKISELFKYTIGGGKFVRALITVCAYKSIKKYNQENITIVRKLGLAIEFLQSAFLVADDIMDNSITRRNKPCWYKLDEIGNSAINDSYILESSVYLIIKKYIEKQDNYIKIYELFHEVSLKTELGQILDMSTDIKNEEFNINKYTIDRVKSIAIYKTSYYTFNLPILLALYYAEFDISNELDKKITRICIEMGIFFQAQDDYLDCYGNPSETGKIGTDIQSGKCSWLIANALNIANSEQKIILVNNYSKNNDKSINYVKEIYSQLNMKKKFEEYEKNTFENIVKETETLPENYKKFIYLILKKLFNRKV